MKLEVTKELFNIKGDAILSGSGEAGAHAVLGDICVEALMRDTPQDQSTPQNIKVKRWNLAKRIQFAVEQKSNGIDLPAGDVDFIKDRISKTFQTAIMGPAFEAMGEVVESQE